MVTDLLDKLKTIVLYEGKTNKDFFEQVISVINKHFKVETNRKTLSELVETKYFALGKVIGVVIEHSTATTYELTHHAIDALSAISRLPEIREKVGKLISTWNSEIDGDAFVDHRPWARKTSALTIEFSRYLSTTDNFILTLALEELKRHGFRNIWYKRFKYGDCLFVRERIDGVVIAKNLPRWATGYLIGKKGQRAKKLGITLKIS